MTADNAERDELGNVSAHGDRQRRPSRSMNRHHRGSRASTPHASEGDLPDRVTGRAQEMLRRLADPAAAGPMAAYMKTRMPFYGVKKPQRNQVVRALEKEFEIDDVETYRRVVARLWTLPHREEKYLAIQLAQTFPRLVGIGSIDLYERLIREGAWWDLVDDVAIRLVGRVWLENRDEVAPRMDRWIEDDDLWIRRAAIIAQIRHKANTDHRRLFSYCRRRAFEKEFFIRKAIGWALREYSKTDPRRVSRFLNQNRDRLSGLSYREGAKVLAARSCR